MNHSRLCGASYPSRLSPYWLVCVFGMLVALTGCNRSANPGAVPRSGVGDETVAVLKVDLALMNADGRLQERIQALSRGTETDWTPFGKMVAALSSNGVSQIAIPVNIGPSMLESVGIYLGGKVRCENEDLETALIEAGGGSPLAAGALFSAVTDTSRGWKFWGVGGGFLSSARGSVARRYEDAFEQGGAAPIQVVVLTPSEDILGDINPQPSDPRLIRQVGRLLKAAKGMESLRLAIASDGSTLSAGALFDRDSGAADFVKSWSALSRDLQLAAGPADSANSRSFAALFEKLAHLTPKADGRWVRWQP